MIEDDPFDLVCFDEVADIIQKIIGINRAKPIPKVNATTSKGIPKSFPEGLISNFIV